MKLKTDLPEPQASSATPELEICRMLTLSTAHITEITDRYISQNLIASFASEFGYIIYTSGESLNYAQGYPEELKALLQFARDNGCDYLNLDRDGPVIPQFPAYKW
jgi:hypothetical protein